MELIPLYYYYIHVHDFFCLDLEGMKACHDVNEALL